MYISNPKSKKKNYILSDSGLKLLKKYIIQSGGSDINYIEELDKLLKENSDSTDTEDSYIDQLEKELNIETKPVKAYRDQTIVSWNVNGCRSSLFDKKIDKKTVLKSILPGNLKTMIDKYNPDIICLQETRLSEELGESIFQFNDYPYKYWNESQGEGARGSNRYSGTCVWCKEKPNNIYFNYLGLDDKEGRFIMIEYTNFTVINVYTPNSGSNFTYRTTHWDTKMKQIIDSLSDKPVIYTGDFNVVSENLDIWNEKTLIKASSPGVYPEERIAFNKYLENFTDVFRYLYPEDKKWTWWDMRSRGRDRNNGWRIDYFLIQKKYLNLIRDCIIDNMIMGSDHCPVILRFRI